MFAGEQLTTLIDVCLYIFSIFYLLKAYDAYLKKYILWMKTIYYPKEIRSHLVTIVPMTCLLLNHLES